MLAKKQKSTMQSCAVVNWEGWVNGADDKEGVEVASHRVKTRARVSKDTLRKNTAIKNKRGIIEQKERNKSR